MYKGVQELPTLHGRQDLFNSDQTRAFSFGLSNPFDMSKQSEEVNTEMKDLQSENNLLKKQNDLLRRVNERLEEENRNFRAIVSTKLSRTPSKSTSRNASQSGNRFSKVSPYIETAKGKTGIKTDASFIQTLQGDKLHQAHSTITSKNRTISQLTKKLRVLQEVKKYQLQTMEEQYKLELTEQKEEIERLQSEVTHLHQSMSKQKTADSITENAVQTYQIQEQNRRLKSKVNKMIQQLNRLNQEKSQLQQIVYELYYQCQTYCKESETIQNVKDHYNNIRAIFQKRSTKQHLSKQTI